MIPTSMSSTKRTPPLRSKKGAQLHRQCHISPNPGGAEFEIDTLKGLEHLSRQVLIRHRPNGNSWTGSSTTP